MSSHGKVFYINHNDKTTHWTLPATATVTTFDAHRRGRARSTGGSPSSPNYSTPFATVDGSFGGISVPSYYEGNAEEEVNHVDLASSVGGQGTHDDLEDRNVADATDVLPRGHRAIDNVDVGSPERAPAATVDVETDSAAAGVVGTRDWSVGLKEHAVAPAAAAEVISVEKMTNGNGVEEVEDMTVGASSVLKAGVFGPTVNKLGSGSVSRGESSHGTPRSEIPEYLSSSRKLTKAEVADAAITGEGEDSVTEEPKESPLPPGAFYLLCNCWKALRTSPPFSVFSMISWTRTLYAKSLSHFGYSKTWRRKKSIGKG